MLFKLCVALILLCNFCGRSVATVYHLNNTEYVQLPPLWQLENYKSCMETAGGVYCVVSLLLYSDRNNGLYTLIEEHSKYATTHYNYTKLERGVCVTRTCENCARNAGLEINGDLTTALEACLNQTMVDKYDLMARVHSVHCDKQTDVHTTYIQVDYIDCIYATVMITLLTLALVGSYCEIYLSNKSGRSHVKGKEFLLCFSVFQNLKKLTALDDDSEPRLYVLRSVYAVRSIASCLIVLIHMFVLISGSFITDPDTIEKNFESFYKRIVLCAFPHIVQIFLFISGLFLTYFRQISSDQKTETWKSIRNAMLQRWWRLTPQAALVVGFMATWMRHLSSGPLWNRYVTSGQAEQCRRFFWQHIFYYNNYVPEDKYCALQTWYIAADMQITFLGLVIHFAIRNRSGKVKAVALLSTLLLGMVSRALHVWWQDLYAFTIMTPEFVRSFLDSSIDQPTFRTIYILGHNNISCFVIGMATGYWIYDLQLKKIDISNSKICNILYWCVPPAFIGTMYCGSLFYNDDDPPTLAFRLLYAAVNKTIVGILMAVWMVGVMFDFKFNGISKTIAEWPGWVIPSRLSYTVYLIHPVFIFASLATRTHLTAVSFLNLFYVYIGVLVTSFLVALPIYLFVEAPSQRLLKLYRNTAFKKKMP